MKGSNQIILNPSQMCEAVEYYFKQVMFKDQHFRVNDVKSSTRTAQTLFEVSMVEDKGVDEPLDMGDE